MIIRKHKVNDSEIIKTGNATFGKRYLYCIGKVEYCLEQGDAEKQCYLIMDSIYLTATGYLTSNFDVQYTDMDKFNFGHLSNTNLAEILYKYGTPHYSTPRVTEKVVAKYKKQQRYKYV